MWVTPIGTSCAFWSVVVSSWQNQLALACAVQFSVFYIDEGTKQIDTETQQIREYKRIHPPRCVM